MLCNGKLKKGKSVLGNTLNDHISSEILSLLQGVGKHH